MNLIKNFLYKTIVIVLGVIGFATMAIASSNPSTQSLAPVLKKIMPAVVHIAVQIQTNAQIIATPQGQARPQLPRRVQGFGSGVIVDVKRGYIITNAHVVDKADNISVKINDGRILKAKLIGSDPASDIAVIQVKADGLVALELGDSDKLQVGDFVAAIGNPFGLSQTVTSGIISALERNNLGIEGYENFIQTDAAINMGNSGGALINMEGQLVGINTALISPSSGGGNVGIGFAIPVNMAKSIMLQLIQFGRIQRGLLGVMVQSLTPQLGQAFGLNDVQGALVTYVSPNSPADKAGVKIGDIIRKINDKAITSHSEVRNITGLLRVGTRAVIHVLRDGKSLQFTMEIADPKQYRDQAEGKQPFLYGMGLIDFEEQSPYDDVRIKGVRIVQIEQNSVAQRAEPALLPGDIIVSANKKPVKNLDDLFAAVAQNKDRLLLNIIRGGGALFIVISPQNG